MAIYINNRPRRPNTLKNKSAPMMNGRRVKKMYKKKNFNLKKKKIMKIDWRVQQMEVTNSTS